MGKTTYQLVQDFSHQQYVSFREGKSLEVEKKPPTHGNPKVTNPRKQKNIKKPRRNSFNGRIFQV